MFVTLFLPFLLSCKPAHYTPATYKSTQLRFGSSGAVTGVIREYILFDDGRLFLSRGDGGVARELLKRSSGETRRIFRKTDELGLATMKFSHPGNISFYLVIKTPKKTNIIKWGETGVDPPAGIKEFYAGLIAEMGN